MGGVFSDQSTVDELTERSNYFIKERVRKIPENFKSKKDHIVREMREASPKAFRGLYSKDYPKKNEKQVNKLAIHDVTSKEIKHQTTREVCAEINPVIEQKTADMNTIVRQATKKAIHMMIKKAVGVAVDNIQAQLERQCGADSSQCQERFEFSENKTEPNEKSQKPIRTEPIALKNEPNSQWF